ncbi:MAG: PQQ-dependent sugar dehydrogenase [Actinobacteria bacterium]|nr:PQQ-dependent sugar dehydrogenase [Actinomycetota bacterium]
MARSARLLALLAVLLPLVVAVPGTAAAAQVDRASGDDRVGTAILLSQAGFPADSTSAVVVAAAGDFPDALAAAPLAAAASAPVLLNPDGGLDPRVEDEIQRLVADPGQATAYLMGGPAAQSPQVADDIEDLGLTVQRVADPDHPHRFGTAAAAARTAVDRWGGDAGSHVLIALGAHPDPHKAWPDALASGALSGHARWPILLVEPGGVPAITNQTLRAMGTEQATVVGGPAAIPEVTAQDLDVDRHDRIGGDDRYHTSTLLADAAAAQGGSLATVVAATGEDFPDGLAAGPVAFAMGGVTVLVASGDLVDSGATKSWFESHAGDVGEVLVAGGPAAVSLETAGQIGFATTDVQLAIQQVGSGFDNPVYVTTPPGDDRLFVVEQPGRIRILGGGTFLDIAGRVSSGGERGLLGLAFHPGYADNGRFFVHYTDSNGDTVVEEYRRATADSAGTEATRRLLFLDQPYSNHNGGHLEVGPDGALYLGLGDGGSGGDPENRAQDTSNLFGAIVRLDPDGGGATNHMHGLRNPYRFSIDATDGLIYIGDVGQNDWEEVDVVPYTAAGTDFGWPCREGAHDYAPDRPRCDGGYTEPVLEYPLPNQGGEGTCAVTGGVVYRGSAIPEMRGQYLYADHCAGWVRGFHYHNGVRSDEREWFETGGNPAGFGIGPEGEVHIALRGGAIVKVVRGGS